MNDTRGGVEGHRYRIVLLDVFEVGCLPKSRLEVVQLLQPIVYLRIVVTDCA